MGQYRIGRDSAVADSSRGPAFVTFSGITFYPWCPYPSDIKIEDIAHASAFTSRFNGHLRSFYSIAQHEVIGSYHVPDEHALDFLLHDGHEAYTGDVIGPIKRGSNIMRSAVGILETRVQAAIVRAFDLPEGHDPCIKEIDDRMLVSEMLNFGHPCASAPGGWVRAMIDSGVVPIGDLGWTAWAPWDAETRFLQRFNELLAYRMNRQRRI